MQAALDSEKGLLGLMVVWGELFQSIRHSLDADMFYSEKHREVWRTLASMDKTGSDIDLISVTQALKASGNFGAIGGSEFLSDISKHSIPRENINHHVSEIRRAFYARQMVRVASAMTQDPSDELVVEMQRYAVARAGESNDKLFDFSKDLSGYIASLEPGKKDKSQSVVTTGFQKLDETLGGLKRGDLLTVSARPGGGKTAFLTTTATNAAGSGLRVLMFTTEMSCYQLMGRIMPYKSKVQAWRFRKLVLEERHYKKVADAASAMSEYQMFLCDKPRPSLSDIHAGIVRVNPDVVVIDYLQRILKPKAENVTRAVDEIMASLKSFCIERRVIGMLGCQMNRMVDREKSFPKLSDLRDGGAIESESDQVLLLHTDPEGSTDSKIKILALLEKNRHGSTGTVDFFLQRELIELTEATDDSVDSDGRGAGRVDSSDPSQERRECKIETENLPSLGSGEWMSASEVIE